MTTATWLREECFAVTSVRTKGVHGRIDVVVGDVTDIQVRAMGTPESVDRVVWRPEGDALVIEDEAGWTNAGGVRSVRAQRVEDGLEVIGTPMQVPPQIGDGVHEPDPAVSVDAVVIEVVAPHGTRVGIGSPGVAMCTYSVGVG